MSNHEKNIDDFFREELDDYVETPPPAAWDALEKTLETRKVVRPGLSKRWFWYFATISLMVSLGVSITRIVSDKRQADTDNFMAANNISNATGNKTANAKNTTSASSNNQTINQEHTNTNAPSSDDRTTAQAEDANTSAAAPTNGSASFKPSASENRNANGRQSIKTNASHLAAANKRTRSKSDHRKRSHNGRADAEEQLIAYNSGSQAGGDDASGIATDNATPPPSLPGQGAKSPLPTQKADSEAVPPTVKQDKKEDKKEHKPAIVRFEAGVKTGYESGFNNDAARKFLVSPYLQYNISKKFAIMTQPAIKTAHLNGRSIGGSQTYYKVNGDAKIRLEDSAMILLVSNDGSLDSEWLRHYSYMQTHDSLIKTNSIGGNYLEFDIPLLLKYALSKKFSVYGGLDVTYGKLISIDEHTYTSDPILKTAYQPTIGRYHAPAPAPVPIDQLITYKGTPITSYTGQEYPSPKGNLLRYGYMIGFNYEYSKRWMLDGMVLQNSVKTDMRAGYNINAALSAAYFRFTLGYKITKGK